MRRFSNPYFLWTELMSTPLVRTLATLGPVGYWGKAPGTNGSFFGLLLFVVFFYPLSFWGYTILLLVTTYLATGICEAAEIRMGKRDPGEVIIDEFFAIPYCFIGLVPFITRQNIAYYLIAAFLVFRFFDILKPLGISKLQDLPGGWGVMIDDIAAALATCGVLHIATGLLLHFGVMPL